MKKQEIRLYAVLSFGLVKYTTYVKKEAYAVRRTLADVIDLPFMRKYYQVVELRGTVKGSE